MITRVKTNSREECVLIGNRKLPPALYGKDNASYKHGQTGTKLYWIWAGIMQRCTNENNIAFNRYGGRGIGICEEWRDSFQAFHDWAIANGYRPGASVDRIDNDGDYCPENCRWSDRIAQNNNRRNNILVTRDGRTQTLAEWAREKNLPYKTILARYHRKGDTEDLFRELKK